VGEERDFRGWSGRGLRVEALLSGGDEMRAMSNSFEKRRLSERQVRVGGWPWREVNDIGACAQPGFTNLALSVAEILRRAFAHVGP
jgi:hypothetical protein